MIRRAVSLIGNGLGVRGEQTHQRACNGQAEQGANGHDPDAHEECQVVELFHTGMLLCTVVVADQGAHPLHDAVGRQIKKGLKFVVDAQHRHIALGEPASSPFRKVTSRAGNGQIQDGRYTDGIELAVKSSIEAQAAAAQKRTDTSVRA